MCYAAEFEWCNQVHIVTSYNKAGIFITYDRVETDCDILVSFYKGDQYVGMIDLEDVEPIGIVGGVYKIYVK